eukprot:GEMP01043095.1.p1 GENE.GEMP01043095.1~~GEMP01043095.1.p1  ORF type:complete len:435 (+),score=72.10 GEMP01043095.1:95-1399(+)
MSPASSTATMAATGRNNSDVDENNDPSSDPITMVRTQLNTNSSYGSMRGGHNNSFGGNASTWSHTSIRSAPSTTRTRKRPLELETGYWLKSVPFLELEASTGDNERAERFLSQYRTFDDVSAWKKRFGMRSKKLGMILVHFMLGRVLADGYERLYLPATNKAKTFWERMGAVEIKHPDSIHTKEIIDEMHCFSAATTSLMCIELTGESPKKPNLPSSDDLERASVAGIFFRTVRCGQFFQAAALIESTDREQLVEMRIKGWSPLHESVQRDDPAEALQLTRLLLERQCNANAKDDEWKQTPLYFAANMDRVRIAQLLVEYTGDVNHRDVHHQPALFYAAKHNSLDVAKYFIEALGVSPSIKDKAGRRAIMYARQANTDASHVNIIEYLDEQEAKRRKIAAPKAATGGRGTGKTGRSAKTHKYSISRTGRPTSKR